MKAFSISGDFSTWPSLYVTVAVSYHKHTELIFCFLLILIKRTEAKCNGSS